ncbi:V-type ATP synthase subunit I [Fonticella tunisiensis]|uniref:V/A-type H+-transporting ATPase subunit I n=1 Tax=Fonticella tunisiensis TaxID=1096341 RepID=A0A4R7KBL6_9CLOT|nr:V-type ATPase 116kDa subunit family protein [Fonticella tunisiensis]TDT51866.1 V/A-type H+-transporting ATPase subunit I [Fonticella tunisiensis]
MAVEKMEMVNIIGHMENVDEIAKKIILSSSVHMVNSITEINQNNFPILQAQDEVDALIDYNYIRQYNSKKDIGSVEAKLRAICEIFEIKNKVYLSHIRESYNFQEDIKAIDEIYQIVEEKHERLLSLNKENDELMILEEYLSYLKHIDINLSELMGMKYMKMKLGKLSKYNMDKLKKNYENISAIVFKLYTDIEYVLVLIVVPQSVEIEVDRVLKSLNFDEYIPAVKYEGSPAEWIEKLNIRKQQIESEIRYIKSCLLDIKHKYMKDIQKYCSRLAMEFKIEELKSHIACTREFFYLTGWVPIYKKKVLLNSLGECQDKLIIIFKEVKETREGLEPPTCLKNTKLLKPFETIVKLYGIPSYRELDPTAFLGISYMLLFGIMFGDVGQGFCLFLAGEFLYRIKKRVNLGGVLVRLGFSSTIFGFLYGSIFGFEDILENYVLKPIRPMENINSMLIGAVVFGVILLSVGFIYNLANSYKNRDIEEGLLGRNGLAGLMFYWILFYYVVSRVMAMETFIPGELITIILVSLLIVMLLKEPLANLIKGVRPLYSESKADYYIEGGFGVVETLLTMFSNTVSFIRVGAFAINHVGLFIAFDTLSKMMSNRAESALVIVLGNLVIIGLEGLIVFIQGLRLEYYELFSKYYSGAGYEYSPCHLEGIAHSKKRRRNINIKSRKSIQINI